MKLDETAVLVVHRNSYDTIGLTLESLVAEGLSPAKAGWKRVIELAAVVCKSSDRAPSYNRARNIWIFLAKHYKRLQRFVVASYSTARSIGRNIRSWWPVSFSDLVNGLALVWGKGKSDSVKSVRIVNPLGGTLAHYAAALASVLEKEGARVSIESINEPSITGGGRYTWLLSYTKMLVRGRLGSAKGRTIIVWPVLGFLDLVLAAVLSGRDTWIVYHDPVPLVRAVGADAFSAKIAARFRMGTGVLVHSKAAAEAMHEAGLGAGQVKLELPMREPAEEYQSPSSNPDDRRVVRVLGQYKADRDLHALDAIARGQDQSVELEIVGRGWPNVPRWKVDSRFVSEEELDSLIRSSDAIVIPYRRFYQSGIAMRALELGTPVVGRSGTSLDEVFGVNSKLLVPANLETGAELELEWSRALRYAMDRGAEVAQDAAQRRFRAVTDEWSAWLAGQSIS